MLRRALLKSLSLLIVGVCTTAISPPMYGQNEAKSSSGKIYELRFYVTNPGKLDALHARFRNHTLGLFEKHGMENIAYWNVVEGAKNDGDKAANMLVYIIAHKNIEAKEASWKAFGADPEWQKVRAESEKDGKILAETPRAILMTETDFSKFDWPKNGTSQDKAKLYELRQYNDGPARVPFTVERFGFGETKLFTDAGMETIKFWKAQDDSAFIYLLAHKDRDAAKESWSKFMGSFQGFMQKYNQEKGGPPKDAAKGNGMEVRFLTPTDYSPRK